MSSAFAFQVFVQPQSTCICNRYIKNNFKARSLVVKRFVVTNGETFQECSLWRLSMGRRSEKIKGRKEAQDKVRTKWFSLIGKKIVAAVRKNGQDVTTNKDLQDALELAKKHNYPKENIQRSISRALNSKEVDLKRMVFELYGVGGVGILVNVCTDNVNRISSDIRAIANKHGIKLAEPGSLSFKFSLKGQIILDNVSGTNEEALLLDVAEAGAEDCIADFEEIDDNKAAIYRVICDPKNLEMVASFLESNHYPCRQRERVFFAIRLY